MWENPRVINQRFFHPFLWPWFVLGGIIALYLLSMTVFYYMYRTEKNNPSHELYQKAIEIRRQELINLKLSAVEPFVWKPLFKCQSLEHKNWNPEKNDDCIKTTLKFVKSPDKTRLGKFIYEEPSTVRLQEESTQPCQICHRLKTQANVEWTFNYTQEKPSTFISSLWEDPDFYYSHAIFWSLVALYIIVRLGFRISHANDLVAVAVRTGRSDLAEMLLAERLKAERRLFVYIEISADYIGGYIPRRHLVRIYKKYFTGSFDYSGFDLRIGIVECNTVSFEGLRLAQSVAAKALSSSVIVQDKLIAFEPAMDIRKAVWKRKDSQLNFNIMEIKKISDGLDGNDNKDNQKEK